MKLFLVKPDLPWFGQYNEMMTEWCESKTQIAPWFLDEPFGREFSGEIDDGLVACPLFVRHILIAVGAWY